MRKILVCLACLSIMAVAQENLPKEFYEQKISYDLAQKLTISGRQYASPKIVKDFYMQNKILLKVKLTEIQIVKNEKQFNDSYKYILAENFSLDRDDPEWDTKLPVKYTVSEILNFENIKASITGGRSYTSLYECEEYFRLNDGDKLGWAFYMYDYKSGGKQKEKCTVGVPNFELKKLDI